MEFKYKQFKGCGPCKLNGNCREYRKKVKITFRKSERADCWGRFVTVFNAGETVKGEAVIKDNTVYCASAKSRIYGNYEDFIGLNNVVIREI